MRQPAKDNTLYQGDRAVSNGAGQHFFAGTTVLGSVRRGLIAFNVAGNVPAGSIIQSVTLRLYVSRGMGGDA